MKMFSIAAISTIALGLILMAVFLALKNQEKKQEPKDKKERSKESRAPDAELQEAIDQAREQMRKGDETHEDLGDTIEELERVVMKKRESGSIDQKLEDELTKAKAAYHESAMRIKKNKEDLLKLEQEVGYKGKQ